MWFSWRRDKIIESLRQEIRRLEDDLQYTKEIVRKGEYETYLAMGTKIIEDRREIMEARDILRKEYTALLDLRAQVYSEREKLLETREAATKQ